MNKRKPFNQSPGYVASLRTGPYLSDGKQGWVVLYDSNLTENGLDSNLNRWVVVCDTHRKFLDHTNQKSARATLKAGSKEFCVKCIRTNK